MKTYIQYMLIRLLWRLGTHSTLHLAPSDLQTRGSWLVLLPDRDSSPTTDVPVLTWEY